MLVLCSVENRGESTTHSVLLISVITCTICIQSERKREEIPHAFCIVFYLEQWGKVQVYFVSFHSNHYHSYSVVREKRGNVIYLTCTIHIENSGENLKILHSFIPSVSMVTPVHLIVLFRKGEEIMLHEILHEMIMKCYMQCYIKSLN